MNLLNLTTDLDRVATALERIANCLTRLCPPIYPEKGTPEPKEYPIEPVTNETTYEYEVDDQLSWYKDKVEMLMKEYGDDLGKS